MKVLMIEHFLPESVYSLELGMELKHHCDLTIFCRKNAAVQETGITWVPQFYSGGRNKVIAAFDYGTSLMRIAELVRKEKFDVVHVQDFKNAQIEMALYYRLRTYVKKFVHTVHNVLPHEISSRDWKLYNKFYEFCDELIVHNDLSKKCLMDKFSVPEEKISVIPHGSYQTQAVHQEVRGDHQIKNFLQFGFIRKYKGIDILLEAIALIAPEKRKNLRFTIAGKQYVKLDATDYKARARELGIEDCVKFISGHIPGNELPGLFGNTDFLLFPYRNIYGSGALLMAYSYEKPVIASDIPAFREETDDGRTGFLFESENPQALAETILKAASCGPGQMEEYQAAIRGLVSEKYNWRKSAAKTAEVYQK